MTIDHAISLNVANTILGQTKKNRTEYNAAADSICRRGHELAWRRAVKLQRREREIVGSEEERRDQRGVNGGMGGHRQHTRVKKRWQACPGT